MKNNHTIPSFLASSDLVKDFGTARNELLIKVLEVYRATSKFFSNINRMYQYLIVVLNIGNSIEEILQEFGVRQVYNTEPVLLLFFMAAFGEILLEDIWEDNGLENGKFQQVSDNDFRRKKES